MSELRRLLGTCTAFGSHGDALTTERLMEAIEKLEKELPPEQVAFIFHNQIHIVDLKKVGDIHVASSVIDGKLIHLSVGEWRKLNMYPSMLKKEEFIA